MTAIGLAWLVTAAAVAAATPTAADFAADAASLDKLIVDNYAYAERWPGGTLPDSVQLKSERAAVTDRKSLLRYAERRIASLADHHAITGSSFPDSWGLVPSYSDLWIDYRGGHYVVGAVRDGSPAAAVGIRRGERLTAVADSTIDKAVADFWGELGLALTDERRAYAARVLATGRRDRPRMLTIGGRTLSLPNLYAMKPASAGPLSISHDAQGRTVVRINNALGEDGTIAAFDEAMGRVPLDAALVIDLRDTPSGGNTTVARAIMSWFTARPSAYQVHSLPAEMRATGIERRWIELVTPRASKYHARPPTVLVGRWTGSMGEGLAIGLKALGARVCGDPMAGLLGAIYDFDLPATGLRVKFPAERLETIWGEPREHVVPDTCG